MQRSTTHDRIKWHGPPRWSLIAGAVTLAIGAMMILAPSATASSASSAKKITAPYSGYGYGYVDFSFYGCGGSASVTAWPALNLTTGHATYAFGVKQVSCGTDINSTFADAGAYIYTPISLATGPQSVETNWKATVAVKLVATPGSTDPTVLSDFSLYPYVYVYDSTNDSIVRETGATSVSDAISTGTFSKTYTNFYFHDWVNYTFNSAHTYYLATYFLAEAYAEAGPGSSSATASINMASSSHRAILESIMIS